MTKKKILMLLGSACLALALAVPMGGGCAGPAPSPTPTPTLTPTPTPEAETVKIVLGNLWGGGNVTLTCDRLKERIETISGGRIQITIAPGGTLVPVAEHLKATGEGIYDLNYMFEKYYKEEEPVFELLSHMWVVLKEPFDCWKISKYGGLDDLSTRIYADHNIHFIGRKGRISDMLITSKPAPHVEDLKGLKVRSEGYCAAAFASLGASVIFLEAEDFYTSVASGLIDGGDLNSIFDNYVMGYYEICPYWIMPSLAKCNTCPLVANMDFWNALSKADQTLIETAWEAVEQGQTQEETYDATNILDIVQEEHGVTVYYWSEDDLRKWDDTIQASVSKHPENAYWAECWKLMHDYAEVMGYE